MPTEPTLIEVTDSSALSGYAYDPAQQLLHIQFKRGGPVYPHYGVPQSIVTGLEAAPSKGRFVSENIRGKFSSKPPEPADADAEETGNSVAG